MEGRTNPLGWPAWAWGSLTALLLLIGLIGSDASLANLVRAAGGMDDIGTVGAVFVQPPGTPAGWSLASEVEPGGAAAEAGIRPGDLVRFDAFLGYQAQTHADWPNPITIERAGRRTHSVLQARAERLDNATRALLAMSAVQSLFELAFGAVLLLRGRNNHTAGMLGIILLCLGAVAGVRPLWVPNMPMLQAVTLLMLPITPLIGYVWPRFSLAVSGGPASERQARLVHIGAVGFAVALGALNLVMAMPAPVPLIGGATAFLAIPIAANQLFGYAIIAANYRRNDEPMRNRIKIVVLAFVCFLLAAVVNSVTGGFTPTDESVTRLLSVRLGFTALAASGVALVAYAVLRQRLFDLRFALNRTLVYATVSFILLAAFGLGEWGVEHLVPPQWHEDSALLGAGIALALFLSFHRLRDWVEHHVERLLFNSWHLNEAALRRFVAAAGHFDRSPALCRAFAQELSRFAHGAGAALYLRDASGAYRLAAGRLPRHRKDYSAEDRAFALMRAERRPVDLRETHSALPGALALPMLDQGTLAGFALLQHKADGSDYRPDEVEVLGWATHQVGLALQAQHARELELQVASLGASLATMTRERDRLEALLTVPQVPPPRRNGRKAAAAPG